MSISSDWQASSTKHSAASPASAGITPERLPQPALDRHRMQSKPVGFSFCFLDPQPADASTQPHQPSTPKTAPATTLRGGGGLMKAKAYPLPAPGGGPYSVDNEFTHMVPGRGEDWTHPTMKTYALSSLSFLQFVFALSLKSCWPRWSFLGVVCEGTRWGPLLEDAHHPGSQQFCSTGVWLTCLIIFNHGDLLENIWKMQKIKSPQRKEKEQ